MRIVFFLSFLQTVNDRADDPDARPMLYDPLQGSKITKSRQYLATVIGTYSNPILFFFSICMNQMKFEHRLKLTINVIN